MYSFFLNKGSVASVLFISYLCFTLLLFFIPDTFFYYFASAQNGSNVPYYVTDSNVLAARYFS